jgi:DnaK suppressor protein
MLIPAEIALLGIKFPTLTIVAIIGFIYWLFVSWYEGRKDGFDSNRMFDLAFTSVIFAGIGFYLYTKLYNYLLIYNPTSPILDLDYELSVGLLSFILLIIPVYLYAKRWKWSAYRLLDIYVVGLSLFITFFTFGRFVVYLDFNYLSIAIVNLIIYLELLRFRGYRFRSGIIFTSYTSFLAIIGCLFLRRDGYLLIYGFLLTISIVNLVIRRKKDMSVTSLPKEFIEAIRKRLLSKDEKLRESQKLLVSEDPYMQRGRSEGNAENMDEAILEDYQKIVNDESRSIVQRLRIQIRRALSAMKIGKYGYCEVCGKSIDKARLEAYPEATTCVECSQTKSDAEN